MRGVLLTLSETSPAVSSFFRVVFVLGIKVSDLYLSPSAE